MNKLNLINYLRIRLSPLFVLDKKDIFPTSDLFLWHKEFNINYMLLNNNFIFREEKEINIRLFILDDKGKVQKINSIKNSSSVFTNINVSNYIDDSYGKYGSFCVFQTLKEIKIAHSQ